MQNTYTIRLTGGPVGDGVEITAVYNDTTPDHVIEQLNRLVELINNK